MHIAIRTFFRHPCEKEHGLELEREAKHLGGIHRGNRLT